jgi:hypothetical protein
MAAHIARILSLITLSAGAALAQAGPMQGPGGDGDYAAGRIETAFLVVEESFPVAVKGDLPLGCTGPFRADVQAECIDAAYEPGADTPEIIETRIGSTSILMRLDDLAVRALIASSE